MQMSANIQLLTLRVEEQSERLERIDRQTQRERQTETQEQTGRYSRKERTAETQEQTRQARTQTDTEIRTIEDCSPSTTSWLRGTPPSSARLAESTQFLDLILPEYSPCTEGVEVQEPGPQPGIAPGGEGAWRSPLDSRNILRSSRRQRLVNFERSFEQLLSLGDGHGDESGHVILGGDSGANNLPHRLPARSSPSSFLSEASQVTISTPSPSRSL